MGATSFVHHDATAPTTISEIRRLHGQVISADFTGAFAYATQSGFAAFSLAMGTDFWAQTPSKWLFSLDYGRTQPQAIRSILNKENANVRIFDGAYVVGNEGFLPRRDFHAKLSLLLNPDEGRSGMVVGSGNFSSNGLRNSIEAGAALFSDTLEEFDAAIAPSVARLDILWEQATPAADVLDDYEERWLNSFSRRGSEQLDEAEQELPQAADMFWIEAGYVTKNRGPYRPGNQIDLPRGMSRYFGYDPALDLQVNSVIGPLTLKPRVGEPVTRDLRFGNNSMEKITLPTPEAHGFDLYDGKVLVFAREAHGFILNALEVADFEAAFGDRLSAVKTMASGRRYGQIG